MDDAEKLKSLKTMAMVVYILQAIGFFTAITWIVAIVLDYVKKDDAAGTWLESHYRWQIRTFWWGLLWGVIGSVLLLILVGWFILVAAGIWIIYRIVRGVVYLNEARPMPL
jgi:uncharacterized membrane protein